MATPPEEARLRVGPAGNRSVRVPLSAFTSGPVGASGPGEDELRSGPVVMWIGGAFVDDPQEGRTERRLQPGGWGAYPQTTSRAGFVKLGRRQGLCRGRGEKCFFPGNSGRGGLERMLIKDVTENQEGRAGRKVPDLELRTAVTGGRALQAAVSTERGLGTVGKAGALGDGAPQEGEVHRVQESGFGLKSSGDTRAEEEPPGGTVDPDACGRDAAVSRLQSSRADSGQAWGLPPSLPAGLCPGKAPRPLTLLSSPLGRASGQAGRPGRNSSIFF